MNMKAGENILDDYLELETGCGSEKRLMLIQSLRDKKIVFDRLHSLPAVQQDKRLVLIFPGEGIHECLLLYSKGTCTESREVQL
ncbi:MAG: hypothetical protein Q8R76_05730 [Candidatus Omnitrophota bacterium]|nr:hypothetical protein [Candidatus Omnitrophota bacterium]